MSIQEAKKTAKFPLCARMKTYLVLRFSNSCWLKGGSSGNSPTMAMKNPPHPGGVVLRECIEPLGLTITAAAAALGVTRTTLSELVNGKRGISPEMAVRLSQVFGGSAVS